MILQTRGGSAGNAPPRTLSFGVIQDESLDLFYKEEVIKQHGFPWNFIATKDKKGEPPRLGIMARKVKWYRQGELAKIRGDTQVRWMTEADPHFFAEIGKRNQADLEKALHVMSSDEFLENTHAIICATLDPRYYLTISGAILECGLAGFLNNNKKANSYLT